MLTKKRQGLWLKTLNPSDLVANPFFFFFFFLVANPDSSTDLG